MIKIHNPLSRVRSYTALALMGWSIVALCLVWINWKWTQDNIMEVALTEARTNIDKDLLYRSWNSLHGGVYVPVTKTTEPNPYLTVPEREITTPSGRLLTLINPAYMTRQVYDLQKSTGLRAHLTSLNPINPNNAADDWETEALKAFEDGATEVHSIETIEDEEYLRLMRAFITKQECLKCHEIQGYKVGDVRGGLSVSIPMSKYAGIRATSTWTILIGYGLLWLVGITSIYASTRDLKKRFEEKETMMDTLEKSREQYRAILQTALDGFWQVDTNGNILEVNHAYCLMSGYSREDLLQMKVNDLDAVDNSEEVKARIRRIVAANKDRFETLHRREDGTLFNVEVSVQYLKSNADTMFAFIRDITERKKAEEDLRHSEEKFRKAFVISPDSININRLQDGMYVTINQGFTDIMGYTSEECIGKTSIELNIWDRVEDRQALVDGLKKHGQIDNLEARFRAKNGSIRYGLMSAAALDLNGEKHIISITRDITERKRTENENLEKTKELEALFSISSHLRTAQTAEEMIPLVLEQISQVLNTDANALILVDEDRKHFTYKLGDGLLAMNTGLQFDADDSISGRIMTTLQPYVTLDFENDPLRTHVIRNSEGVGPALLVPLQSETEFVGVLLCARAKGSPTGPFTPSEVKLLTAIGEMVGNALRRAKLYDDALARMQRVQALRSIDAAINANMDSIITLRVLINQILSLMKVDAAAVLLYNPVTHTLEHAASHGFKYKDIQNARAKLSYGFANTVIVDRRLIKIQDLKQAEDPIYREIAIKENFTSCHIAPMIAKGQICGILEVYSRTALAPNQEWNDFLEALGGQAAIAINNAQLFTNLEKSNLELSLAYDATIEGWSKALELKDRETEGHTLRVTAWTVELARLAGLKEVEITHIRRGALLHDIGKMGIPDRILKKAGELTAGEWKIMRQHTEHAYNMLYPIAFLRPAIDIPYCHHERWNGTGYPRKLKSEQIPFVARLFAIIDVWDAITSNRPYRKAWIFQKAFQHMKSEAGQHFDPEIVNLFTKEIDRFTRNGEIK